MRSKTDEEHNARQVFNIGEYIFKRIENFLLSLVLKKWGYGTERFTLLMIAELKKKTT